VVNDGDVMISWDPVTQSTIGTPLTPDGYSVYYASHPDLPPEEYTYLDDTTSTSYIHPGVASSLERMFYYVVAFKNAPPIPPDFVLVPGGAMTLGDITMSVSTFLIGKYEVTQAEYQAVMGSNPSSFNTVDNGPVDNISWYRAIRYCNYRSMQENLTPAYFYQLGDTNYGTDPGYWPAGWNTYGYNHVNVHCNWSADGYRLPTEMEWMFAAKGGNLSHNYVYSGSNNINAVAWWGGPYGGNSGNTTHTVGILVPNELLAYDMSGNVQEWCWDIYAAYPATSQTNYVGPMTGNYRVFRGGNWQSTSGSCDVEYRLYTDTAIYTSNFGLRLARNY
jgi:formylglycine-generating enzyme required for sulfatase activity